MKPARGIRRIFFNRTKFHDQSVRFAAMPCGKSTPPSLDFEKMTETFRNFLQSHRITPYGFCQRVSEDNARLYRYGREIAMLNALKARGMVCGSEYEKIKQTIRKAYHINAIAETGNDIL